MIMLKILGIILFYIAYYNTLYEVIYQFDTKDNYKQHWKNIFSKKLIYLNLFVLILLISLFIPF